MKKPLPYVFSALLALVSSGACADEAVFGIWIRGGGHQEKMEFFDCEGKLCARGVIPLPDGSPPPLILRSAAKTGPNHWKGELFNPENGKTYSGSITLDNPKQLTLTGCLFAFLCQSETWTKAPKDAAATPAVKESSTVPGQKIAPAQKSPTPKISPQSAPKSPATGH